MEESKVLLFLSLVTVVGIAVLYILAAGVDTEPVLLSELDPSMSGQRISTQGVLLKVDGSQDGAWITLGSPTNDNELDVYVENVVDTGPLIPGSTWEVEGELVLSGSRLVMFLDNMGSMRMIHDAGSTEIPIDTLCSSPEFYIGLKVSIVGDVSGVYSYSNSTTAYVSSNIDGSVWSIRCVAFGTSVIQEGQQVSIHGTFDYDRSRGCYQIIIE